MEVQQVTTRQQTENAEWVVQDEIRKASQAWVEKANATHTERMRQESANNLPREEDTTSPDSIGQALVDCEITMTVEKLLRLVP